MTDSVFVTKAIWNAILKDGWMWAVCWGPNRYGKSSLALQLSYAVYKDWDKVLDSVVFTLTDLFHKKKQGKPERWAPEGSFNSRIPLLIWDDMAVHLNKAATQHDLSVDYFKGYFQAIATDLGVLIATMLTPTGITLQLHEIYTHEIYLPERGTYKFDTVHWRPNFYGWHVNPNKAWIETEKFMPVPADVYREYNEMRKALTGEIEEKIMDQLATGIPGIIKRLKPVDFTVLEVMRDSGRIYDSVFYDSYDDAANIRARLKSRGLISALRVKGHYHYEITDLGLEVLREKESEELSHLQTAEKAEIPV